MGNLMRALDWNMMVIVYDLFWLYFHVIQICSCQSLPWPSEFLRLPRKLRFQLRHGHAPYNVSAKRAKMGRRFNKSSLSHSSLSRNFFPCKEDGAAPAVPEVPCPAQCPQKMQQGGHLKALKAFSFFWFWRLKNMLNCFYRCCINVHVLAS